LISRIVFIFVTKFHVQLMDPLKWQPWVS